MKNYLFILAIALFSCKQEKQLFTAKNGVTTLLNQQLLNIDKDVLSDIYVSNKKELNLTIPFKGTLIDLELTRQDNDLKVFTNEGEFFAKEPVFYSGKVKGEDKSLVSFTITETVTGLISSVKHGDINLGNSGDTYSAYTVEDSITFNCMTEETKDIITHHFDVFTQALKPVKIGFELTNENFVYFGNTQACVNWISGIFSGVKTFYANEQVTLNLGTIFVNTQPDTYNKTNIQTALYEFQAKRQNDPLFKDCNLVQLVRGKTSGSLGGIAFVSGMCSNYRFSVAEPTFNYAAYPNYSWSVTVVGHELGHNLGSPHTHNCNWQKPDGTIGAIDACYKTEGGCTAPIPIKGTLLSYCHLLQSVGISFAEGLGKLPGDLIRFKVSIAPCLIEDNTPTCSDGIKNGTETGIDCGGTCPPCPVISSNIALGKKAVQSTQWNPLPSTNPTAYAADKVNDGNPRSFNHTLAENNPYVYIDLNNSTALTQIKITNRGDNCTACVQQERLKEFKVYVSDQPVTTFSGGEIYSNNRTLGNGETIIIPLNKKGRYISLVVNYPVKNHLHVAEIEAFSNTIVKCDTIKVPYDSIIVIKKVKDSIICK